MAENQRTSRRTLLALAGIVALCAVAIFIAITILIIRVNSPLNDPLVGVPITVGGQKVIIYPNPTMSVRIVAGQSSSLSPDNSAPAQSGVGGQPLAAATPEQPAVNLPPSPATATPRPPAVILEDYLVAPGDTLYRLAQAHNTSIELMATHNIAAASLTAGATVRLPVANPDFCPGGRAHVVRNQQTVSEIARLYGMTTQAIGAANGLDANYSVKSSQVICVP
ncbi:MAG: LysM peptidoglycan-binding domain-containing protein [Chloroflexota bacterium]|jgi:LysM repeat protein